MTLSFIGGQTRAQRACAAVGWSSLLGLSLVLFPALRASGSCFSPGANVVLLAGLPGDLESENLYRNQVQSWLDLLCNQGQASGLWVLCDDTNSVSAPSKPKVSIARADRAQFLALGQSLAGQTNPLVVIALGHGGRQGLTPVFHVRGPRITNADFRSLAVQTASAESRWILLFRGSGAFASQIAGRNRLVLASERDSMFSNDPIGMGMLLQLARDQASLSFDELAERLGESTAAWYRERNLARTEEPTLWNGTAPPKLLAAAAEAATVPDTKNPAPAATAPAASNRPPTVAAQGLPPAWKEIKPVDPQQYPDSDGVVLRRQLSYTLGNNPAIQSEQDEFIQILTPEGKRLGDIDVSFSPPFEELSFIDCEVLQPDGKLLRLDPDAVREMRQNELGDYQREQRKFFSLPGVVPGAVLHVHYRTQWKSFPLPHISMQIPLDADLPVVQSRLEVSVPTGKPFHFALDGLAARDPVISQSQYGTTYAWLIENLPAQMQDVLTSPRQHPRLLLSTFPDWKDFGEWYGRISRLTAEVTPEIETKAAELTRGATTPREKVLALYNYVTRLRYVAVPLGVNSFRPHAAANVLQNQYGDCKDKANLFNALLHTLKFDAQLVLVPRFSQAFEALPGLAFNHAISRVTVEGEPLWIDTTDDVCRFGLLPPGDPGRKVLVIDGHSDTLTQLPAPEAKEHRLEIKGTIDCTQLAGAIPISLRATAHGYPDYVFREAAREAKEHGASIPLLNARYRPLAGAFGLERQRATSVSALDEDFTWECEGAGVGLVSKVDGKEVLRPPFWIPKEWELVLHRRQAALFLNQGYPLLIEEELEFVLPDHTLPAALPAMAEDPQEPLRWRVEWQTSGPNKLIARMRAELTRAELTPSETPRAQEQLRTLLIALGAGVSLAPGNVGGTDGP